MSLQQSLFAEFPPISTEAWRTKIEKDLRGRPFEDLQWLLGEGILLEPYYRKEDIEGMDSSILQDLQEGNTWQIAENITVSSLKTANQQVLQALMGGVEAPCFLIECNLSTDDLEVLTKGIQFEYISTHFHLGKAINRRAFNTTLLDLLARKGIAIQHFKGSIMGGDYLASHSFHSLGIDATPFYNGISRIPHELANSLHAAVNRIMAATDEHPVDELLPAVFFNMSISSSYFVAIAKLRALRLLWTRICEGFGQAATAVGLSVHFAKDAYTTDRNENMIRAATLSMSAVLGGADRLTVRPTDEEGSAFSRRIARNVQHLLKMESGFDQVADPAGGSYYVEKLTHTFVEKAWTLFLGMEKASH